MIAIKAIIDQAILSAAGWLAFLAIDIITIPIAPVRFNN
jgi:hypothetical protein